MNYRLILIGAFLFPVVSWAQTNDDVLRQKADSVVQADLSMVGVMDLEALGDDESDDQGGQDVNTTVLVSHDVFLNRVSYQLSPARFRVRGYDNIYEQKYINGVAFNDQFRGVFNYSSIGAINDLTRNGDETVNNDPGTYTFGSLGGSENILMRAGDFARGGKATLSYTNRNYYLRGMVSYSTGLSDRGWAFTALVGGRYSNEGNIEGTFYRNVSYAMLLEKQWASGKHRLSFTTFGSPVQRGQQGSSMQEVYDLTGNNLYNPNWGYQNGKKRNARVVTAYDPTGILSYEWKIKPEVTFTAGLGVHYGRYGGTALNWYNGADPRPDYYRYLPSYFNDNSVIADEYTDRWLSGDPAFTQIDWDALYEANLVNKLTGNGAAVYMVEERRSDLFETTFNSTIDARLSKHMRLTAGIGARTTTSHQFKTVEDLLGADYVLDIDKFAERDFPSDLNKIQSDLNRPNRKVYEGGIFGYDFKLHINSLNAWLVNNYTTQHWDAYYGVKLTYTDFWRDGNMRNGQYPDNSYGAGRHHAFTDLAFKGGATYKFNGRHLLRANLSYGSEAPIPYDAYISPRISDRTTPLESGRVFSADLSYIFSTRKLTGRISVFQTNFYDQMERSSYYDNQLGTFINHVLRGVSRVHHGIEIGATYKLDDHWSFDLAGTVAEYYYSNNPIGTSNSENGAVADKTETIFMDGLHVGGVPQMAGTFGVRYFINYWFLGANFNAFGRNYVEPAPARHKASSYEGLTPTLEEDRAILAELSSQEEFDPGYTVDLSVGKIFYLKDRTSLNVNLSVNNLLNKKDIRTGGYEQGRVDPDRPYLFKSKYFYMQGINCFLNVSYRF